MPPGPERTRLAPLSEHDADRLDREDSLRSLRGLFSVPAGTLYLCGNSLGPMPHVAATRAADVVGREWAQDLIRSWNVNDWFSLPERLGARIARLVGAGSHEVIVADSTSVNLYKVVRAALRLRADRRAIVAELGNFPTNAYVLQGLAREQATELRAVEREVVFDAIDRHTAVVVLTHAHYRDAALFDMETVTRKAHACGALVVWDLSHSIGVLPVDLNATRSDFAVGCTYKYLNGGPGAPAFIFAAERHHAELDPGLLGWWGHRQPFDLTEDYAPHDGVRRMLTGTGSILALTVLEAALDAFEGVEMQQVRAKSTGLTSAFIELVQHRCSGLGVSVATPLDPAQRGGHVALRHPAGYAVMQALIARNVIGDFRAPDVMRFGLSPLYVGYRDVWDAVEILADLIGSGEWRKPEFAHRGRVT